MNLRMLKRFNFICCAYLLDVSSLHTLVKLFISFLHQVYHAPSSASIATPSLSFLALPCRSSLSSNTTLYFLPGTHNLKSEHVIGNISELHLLSVSDFPLEMATISCWPTARMLIGNVHLVHMSHLHFVGCGENKIESVNQLIINNVMFRGLQGRNGTALELVHTNAKIINSSFLFNQYRSY